MRFVTLRELKLNPSKVLKDLEQEDVVITRRSKPAAALVYLDEELLDEFILAHHPTLLREVEEARREYEREGGINHATMKERVDRRSG